MSVIQRFLLIIMLGCLTRSAFAQVAATNQPAINHPINFRNVRVSQVLQIYHNATQLQLAVAADVLQEKRTITLVATAHSPEEVATLIQQALLKQTGITITMIDDKHASVRYRPKPEEVK
jgi:type II secretory pathway component GspD/PulD (secretin)